MAAASGEGTEINAAAIVRNNGDTDAPVIMAIAHNTSNVSFWVAPQIQEFHTFVIRSVSARCGVGIHVIEHEGKHVHVVVQTNGLVGVVLTSAEYPKRVAISMIREQLVLFEKEHGSKWKSSVEDMQFPLASLSESMDKYQKPEEVDKMMRVTKSLDETKDILVKSIDEVLERGEKLEDLVDISKDLSAQSKMFYKGAASTNSCCLIV